MSEKYLLRLSERDDGKTTDILIQGILPREGEDFRVVPSRSQEIGYCTRYYKVTRVLHTLLEDKVQDKMGKKRGTTELPQVYAQRKQE